MPHRTARRMLHAAIVTLLTASAALGGTVVTRDGRELLGEVRLQSPASVVVRTNAGEQTLSLGDIAAVDLSTPAGETSEGLPAGWKRVDVGNVAVPGKASVEGGTFTLAGAGWGVWSNVDSCLFVHQSIDGDGQVIARVPAYAKDARVSAGVMVRASLDPAAPMAALMVDATRQVRFNSRPLARFTLENKPALVADREKPVWLRLTRTGRWLIAYTSSDGSAWSPIGWQDLEIGEEGKVLVGLAVASRFNSALATASLDHVQVVAGDVKTTPLPRSPLPARGVVLKTGDSAPLTLQWLSSDTAGLSDGATRPAGDVAWAIFDPTFPDVPGLFAANGPGVVLKNGDYLGGEITGVGNGWVNVESILFGPKSYEIDKDIAAIALRAPEQWSNAYHVRTRDGQSRCVADLKVEGDTLVAGTATIPLADVRSILFAARP